MTKSQVDGTTLLVAVVALALSLTLLPGAFAWLGSICGLVLVFVLLGYDRETYRTAFESLGFSAVVALSLTVAITVILRVLAGTLNQPAPIDGRIGSEWMPAIWAFLTAVFWPVDRARMSGRVAVPATTQAAALPASSFSSSTLFAPAPLPAPAPTVPASAPPPVATSPEPPRMVVRESVAPPPVQQPAVVQQPTPVLQPAPVPPASSLRPTFTQPAFAEAVPEPVVAAAHYVPPAPLPQAVPPSPPSAYAPPTPPPAAYAPPPPPPASFAPPAQPVFPPQPPVAPPPPPPQVPPIPAGKEAMIYVSLLGEGINVLRAVRAENLGRDYYKIADEMPAGETWQFVPGQVVRCKKKNLSSGKAMVATEEAQRAR